MPPDPETANPEKPALERDLLTLEELGQIVAITPGDRGRDAAEDFKKIYPDRLRDEAFFQSPVDKSAWTILKDGKPKGRKSFVFNEFGVLSSPKSAEALLAWLKPRKSDAIKIKKALDAWITKGTPTEGILFDEIEKGLREAAVRPELLYNQPICRLVRQDQLRYDPNYQALYQITPAQEQLTKMKSQDFKADHDSVKRNQRVYWGISETFQSLVALFDSDLGRGEDATKNKKAGKITKEFIRITVQEEQDGSSKTTSLFPAGLNRYSPLRFWSPPPSFASSVFHMLFWRSIITGKDLFGREVKGKTVQKRTESYYVIVNYFNPAKFRIAEYPNLFRAILTIARELANCAGLEDLALPDAGRTRLFYPRYFPEVEPKFQEFEKLTLSIPFSDYPTPETVWDLAEAYKSKQSPDPIRCLLRFLRDRAIELILWSSYQMEIRSIGLIPIQYLYQINLTEDLPQFFEDMIARYRESPENFSDINKRVSEKLLEPNFNNKIKLRKAYGGPHRDVFRPEILKRKIWLARHNPKSPPRRASGRVSKVGETLPPAPRRKSK